MRKFISTQLILTAVAALALWQPAQVLGADLAKAIPESAMLQASIALQAGQQLSTAQTFRALGFSSAGEAKASTLGTPWRVYMVRLDRLQAYSASTSPADLLEDTHAVRYPVHVNDEVRSGIVVREIGAGWQTESVGRPALTKALVAASQSAGGANTGSQFVVTVPALNLYFVGRIVNATIELTSAIDDDKFGLKTGQAMPADQVFEAIAAQAKALKTGPYIAN